MEQLLSEAEAARRLGIHTRTLADIRRAGKIAHYMIGRRARYTEADLAAYMTSCRREPKQPEKMLPTKATPGVHMPLLSEAAVRALREQMRADRKKGGKRIRRTQTD